MFRTAGADVRAPNPAVFGPFSKPTESGAMYRLPCPMLEVQSGPRLDHIGHLRPEDLSTPLYWSNSTAVFSLDRGDFLGVLDNSRQTAIINGGIWISAFVPEASFRFYCIPETEAAFLRHPEHSVHCDAVIL